MENFTTYYQEHKIKKHSSPSSSNPDVLPATERIIVIGDIHGDWKITQQIFLKFKLINSNGKWIAEPKNTHVVQVGDILDRGGRPDTIGDECSEVKIMDFLDEIHSQAKLYGGGVFCVLGNHELMNVLGNFDYAGQESVKCFGGSEGRKKAFSPGGVMAKRFANTRNAVLQIGKFLFVHGGFNQKHLTKTIPEINNVMRKFLEGNEKVYDRKFIDYFMAYNGILWNRELSLGSPDCEKLETILNHFNVNGLIVGHTVQESGINSKCNNKIWRVDTGMSDAFGKINKKIQVLEILDNGEPTDKNNNNPFRVLK